MKMKPLMNALLVMLFAITAGCATADAIRHQYIMRGQILDVTDGETYLCIGSKDGAQVGQELTVYKFTKTVSFQSKTGPSPAFKREATGTVKITEIVNDHFAKAKVVNGKADVNSVVEGL